MSAMCWLYYTLSMSNATGEYIASLPDGSKRKTFKPGTEKLKKFEDMVKEFPKNLATPVDIAFLRKIVRQERSNKTRRDKRKSGGGGDGTAAGYGDLQQHQDSNINIPQRGTEFSSIVFDTQDFDEKETEWNVGLLWYLYFPVPLECQISLCIDVCIGISITYYVHTAIQA